MSYTETELTGALAEAERQGDARVAANIRERLATLKGPVPKMPKMQAYLDRCIARCRPKGAK